MTLISNLKSRFPNIELSYEKILHTKVSADYFLLEPEGERCFVWLTCNKALPVSYIVHINKYNNIEKFVPISLCFDKKLALGTLLYGVNFCINNIKHFCCLDILLFKGEDVSKINFHRS